MDQKIGLSVELPEYTAVATSAASISKCNAATDTMDILDYNSMQ